MIRCSGLVVLGTLFSVMTMAQGSFPQAVISNGQISAKVYLPDAKQGFYRGTRFDWSGVVYSLRAHGHDYYGPWFSKTNPQVHDFTYEGTDIVAGPCSAITGPVDDFGPLGFDEAKAGGTFVKVGVGTLKKPDESKYDQFRLYDILDGGQWTVHPTDSAIEFTQQLTDAHSGYGFVYRKTLRLVPGKEQMVLEHHLKNTGHKQIHTSVYNHNFLVLDGQGTGPDFRIRVPFAIQTSQPPKKELAEVQGDQIIFRKALTGEEVVHMPVSGFSDAAKDNAFQIENQRLGAGMRAATDSPLSQESLWSIRTVIAMEPYVSITVEPGVEFSWATTYDYYMIPAAK